MFLRIVIIILLISKFSIAQNSPRLFDSIIKYKHVNPSLALEYGLEYEKNNLDRKTDKETIQFHGAMGEILRTMGFDASALEYLKRALKLNETIPVDQRRFPEIDQLPALRFNVFK